MGNVLDNYKRYGKMDKLKNIVFDTDYTSLIPEGWYPRYDFLLNQNIVPPQDTDNEDKDKKKKWFMWWINDIMEKIIPSWSKDKSPGTDKKSTTGDIVTTIDWPLKDQIKKLTELPDDQYSDKLLTSELRWYLIDVEKQFLTATTNYKTHISPSYRELKASNYNISWLIGKAYYTNNYPSYMDYMWTKDVLQFYGKRDMSWYIYPANDWDIQSMLKRRTSQLKAEINELMSKGITVDTELQIEYNDVENIRQKLATKEERYFELSNYTTLYNTDTEKLNEDSKRFEQKMWWYGIGIKPAIQRMDEWFTANLPMMIDDLSIYRSAVTTSLAGSFPFISSDLIDSTGILYGVNLHTWWLVIFDRFGKKLPNANAVVLATSWAGKSFTVKLEILRYLLEWIDIIVIDPENEYSWLVNQVWWQYINIAINSNQFINPFDLPPKVQDVEYWPWDLLRSQILGLIWLIWVIVWWLTPEEEALLDKALQSTYALRGITFDIDDYSGKSIPQMSDLLSILEWTNWAEKLALKLSKYVTGTFAKLFNNQTNVDLNTGLTVFSIRDIEDALKTPAMYNVLNYIWTKVRSNKTKRLLIIDEAWIMMQNKISADFLFGLIKRARKYMLWVTTISQDVDDFIWSEYGKPIITNSALQILLRQSTASIVWLEKTFWLSEAEKQKLVSSGIWEGLMFVWNQHVAVKILASWFEKDFIDG